MRALMAFCAGGALLYAAGTVLQVPGLDLVLDDVVSNLAIAGAATLCLLRARHGPGARAPWIVLGAGIASWGAGAVAYDLIDRFAGAVPFPSVADAFWLPFYAAAYVALGLLMRARLRRVHPAAWLDGAIGAAAVGALAAAVVFEPVRAHTGGTLWAVVVNLAYPLADLLLAGFLVLSLAADGWRIGRTKLLMLSAFALLLACDTVYLLTATAGTYDANTIMGAGWPVALVLLGLAAWQPERERRSAPTVTGWVAMAAPSAFTILAVALLIYGNARPLGALAVILATVTLLLVAVRTGLSFRTVQELAVSRRQAVTDELTGLPNRRLLYDRLDRAILARRDTGTLTVLLIDLDGFKEVNDSLGHSAGDLLLARIGPRLRDALRGGDLLARLGGDEFGVLLDGADSGEALSVAARVRKALERPVEVQGLALMVDASIGIATYPEHGIDAESLMQHADVAMYHAKSARSGCEIYTPERDASSRERLALLGRLRHAVDAGELVVHYQPKADLSTGAIVGVEALVRWLHPERGLLMPVHFLPVAEQTALMRPMTLQVLDKALADCRRWAHNGHHVAVAVNLAVANLIDRGFPADVAAALDRHAVPAEMLELEITENIVMADPARALEVLQALRELGIGLALDDFGTGQSSLSELRRLAVDEIKIDRSFVSEMVADEDAAAIVRCTVDLARALRLRVVAEGAEDATTWTALREAGCHVGQGYFLSRPVPSHELQSWLGRRGAAAAAH